MIMKKRYASNTLSGSTLGERELRVMEVLWQEPGLDARQVTDRLTGHRPSLSTVQSTLERLCRKQLVSRHKEGSAYRHTAIVTRSGLLGRMLGDVIHLLHDGRMETILSSFVNVAADMDEHSLAELEAMILSKRRDRETGHEN